MSFCCDPLERPCPGALVHLWEGGVLPWLPTGSLVSVPVGPLPQLAPGLDLEVRSQGSCSFQASSQPFSLYLDCLDPFDLGVAEEVIEAAAAAGCDWVVAAPVADQALRYRLYSLVRLLCDRFKLKFSIFEDQPREPADRLNHYLASRRGCCRFRSLGGLR
ncbi:MAG: hypothetical protein U0931_01985 [Vulcanimicrobiota bacterium]